MICRNRVSNITFTDIVILRENITELVVESIQPGWQTNQLTHMTVTMATGSHVEFDVDFGDSSLQQYVHPNRLSYEDTFAINHTFTSPANYTVNVKAFNKYFSTLNTTVVIVQKEIAHSLSKKKLNQ